MSIKLSEIPEEITNSAGLIMLAFRGSIAHGMYVPPENKDSIDDIDLVGVYIAPIEHYFGFQTAKTVEKKIGRYDYVQYEFLNYLQLLCKSNPNILGTLWLNPEHYIHRSAWFGEIMKKRNCFVSKSAYKPFKGYGYSQFQRMYGDREYKGWLGSKRKELVDRFGYDTKMAAHCIRLLRMGAEYLRTGEMIVDRTYLDADYLREIKRGGLSQSIVEYIIRESLDDLDVAYGESTLYDKPETESIERLAVRILKRHFLCHNDAKTGGYEMFRRLC